MLVNIAVVFQPLLDVASDACSLASSCHVLSHVNFCTDDEIKPKTELSNYVFCALDIFK